MGLKIWEGFDHMGSNVLLALKGGWTETLTGLGSGGSVTTSFVTGRLRQKAISLNVQGGSGTGTAVATWRRIFPAAYATVFVGMAFKATFWASNPGSNDFLIIGISGTDTLRVCIDSSNHLVVRNSAGTTIATGTSTIVSGVWRYLEVKLFVNGASGTVEVHLDGATEIASTVGNFGSTSVDRLTLRAADNLNSGSHTNGFATLVVDDLYVCDTSGGAPNNTFLGDVTVVTTYPSADGAHTDYTPNSGSPHFSRVNESSSTYPDGDTSYVSDATVGHRDSYVFDDLPQLAGTVFGVKTVLYARKDDAGTRQLAAVTRPASTDRDGATVTMGTSYAFFEEIAELNPDTSAAWTISQFNATEFGVKTVA